MPSRPKLEPEVKLKVDAYGGEFYKPDARNNGRWRKFQTIGNAGVAMEVAKMLEKLGHKVQVIDLETGDDL